MTAELAGALAAATAVAAAVLAGAVADASVPVRLPHPDREALRDAGWRSGLRRWEAVRGAATAGVLVAAVTGGAPPALALIGAVAPSVWIRLRAEAAREGARRAVGPLISATEAALRSGAALPEALRRAADGAGDPLAAAPIRQALRAFDLGASLEAALAASADAARDERSRLALGTLVLGVGERLPRERLAELLAAVADRVSFEDRLADEVHARAAGARQQQRLLAALVPGLALYLALTIPTLAATLGTDLGRYVLLPAAAVLEAAGIALGRRVVRQAVR